MKNSLNEIGVAVFLLFIGMNALSCTEDIRVRSASQFGRAGWDCAQATHAKPLAGGDMLLRCDENDKHEYYYMSGLGHALPDSIKMGRPEMIEHSCRETAGAAMMFEFSRIPTGLCPSGILPDAEENTAARKELRQHANNNLKIVSCCAFDEKAGACRASSDADWSLCQCRGTVYHPGGFDKFREKYYMNNCY